MTGALSGAVREPQGGAPVVDAEVTLVNEASRDLRRTRTNAAGVFAFAAVPPASYSVSIETPGYARFERRGVLLHIGDSRTLGTVTLEVAGLLDFGPPPAPTTASLPEPPPVVPSGERSSTVTLSQIEATGTLSRNATELIRILPGMTPVTTPQQNRPAFTGEVVGISGTGEGGRSSPVGSYSVNGTSTEALDVTIDGAPGGDPGCHCATAVNPNAEMTREFKVLQANYGAEHAKGPVALSVVSKSGGRDFHGTLYTVLRNYRLNSNEWYGNKVGAERAKNEFFYPGFGVSGPLLIPGTKFNPGRDKAFFYLGYEHFKQRLDTGFVKSWVPTQAMRQGDFSQAASLGLSGGWVNSVPKGYVGGIIPQSEIDPGGRALLGVMPSPNADPFRTGGYNYVDDILVSQNGHQLLARIDWNTSESSKLLVRYARQREVQPFVIGLWERSGERQLPYPSPISGKNQSDSVTVSLTHVFDPTLTNEAAFAVTYINLPNAFDAPTAVDRAGISYPYGGVFGQSPAQIPSVDSGGGGASGPLYYAPGGFDPARFAEKWQITLQDDVTKVAGNHTVKFGAYYEYVTNNEPGANESNGLLIASTDPARHAATTGNSFADLLLGRMGEYREYTGNVLHNIRHHVVEAYAQDSWRVRPNLTLDFGLRASYLGPWTDREGIGMAAWDLGRYESDKKAGAEFPGISWNARDASVPLSGRRRPSIFLTPRAGFALDIRGTGATVLRGGFGAYRYHEPQAVYASLLDLPAGVRSVTLTDSPTLRSIEGTGGGAVVFNGNTILGEDAEQPVTYSWSLSFAQRLPWSMRAEAGYVGNKSDHLRNETLANDNPVPVGAMYGDPAGDATRYRLLAPYGAINVYRHSLYSNYNALQMLVSRQRGRFDFTLAYTFSKSLGIRTGSGATNSESLLDVRQTSYGTLATDRTHVATATYSVTLPTLADKGEVLRKIAGGWRLAGVSTYISGASLQASSGAANFSMTGSFADGSPIIATRVTGTPDLAAMPLLTCDPTRNVPDGYLFNNTCFAPPTPYDPVTGKGGVNGPFVMPTMRGQSYLSHDLSAFKTFSVGSKGHRLEFRVSAFNVLNHPIRYPDLGQNLTLRFERGVLANPDEFGALPQDNKFGRRIVQIALRYMF